MNSQLLNLDNLSEEEKLIILKVIKRDEDLRWRKTQQINQLKNDLHSIRIKSILHDGDDLTKMCARCHQAFGFFFDTGDICPQCKFKVCKSCREIHLSGSWSCTLCFKQVQLKLLTGEWMKTADKKKLNQFAYGGDIVKASIRRSFSHRSLLGVEDGSPTAGRAVVNNREDIQRAGYPQDSDKKRLNQLFESFRSNTSDADANPSITRVSCRRRRDSGSSSSSEEAVKVDKSRLPRNTSVCDSMTSSEPGLVTSRATSETESALNSPISKNVIMPHQLPNGNTVKVREKNKSSDTVSMSSSSENARISSTESGQNATQSGVKTSQLTNETPSNLRPASASPRRTVGLSPEHSKIHIRKGSGQSDVSSVSSARTASPATKMRLLDLASNRALERDTSDGSDIDDLHYGQSRQHKHSSSHHIDSGDSETELEYQEGLKGGPKIIKIKSNYTDGDYLDSKISDFSETDSFFSLSFDVSHDTECKVCMLSNKTGLCCIKHDNPSDCMINHSQFTNHETFSLSSHDSSNNGAANESPHAPSASCLTASALQHFNDTLAEFSDSDSHDDTYTNVSVTNSFSSNSLSFFTPETNINMFNNNNDNANLLTESRADNSREIPKIPLLTPENETCLSMETTESPDYDVFQHGTLARKDVSYERCSKYVSNIEEYVNLDENSDTEETSDELQVGKTFIYGEADQLLTDLKQDSDSNFLNLSHKDGTDKPVVCAEKNINCFRIEETDEVSDNLSVISEITEPDDDDDLSLSDLASNAQVDENDNIDDLANQSIEVLNDDQYNLGNIFKTKSPRLRKNKKKFTIIHKDKSEDDHLKEQAESSNSDIGIIVGESRNDVPESDANSRNECGGAVKVTDPSPQPIHKDEHIQAPNDNSNIDCILKEKVNGSVDKIVMNKTDQYPRDWDTQAVYQDTAGVRTAQQFKTKSQEAVQGVMLPSEISINLIKKTDGMADEDLKKIKPYLTEDTQAVYQDTAGVRTAHQFKTNSQEALQGVMLPSEIKNEDFDDSDLKKIKPYLTEEAVNQITSCDKTKSKEQHHEEYEATNETLSTVGLSETVNKEDLNAAKDSCGLPIRPPRYHKMQTITKTTSNTGNSSESKQSRSCQTQDGVVDLVSGMMSVSSDVTSNFLEITGSTLSGSKFKCIEDGEQSMRIMKSGQEGRATEDSLNGDRLKVSVVKEEDILDVKMRKAAAMPQNVDFDVKEQTIVDNQAIQKVVTIEPLCDDENTPETNPAVHTTQEVCTNEKGISKNYLGNNFTAQNVTSTSLNMQINPAVSSPKMIITEDSQRWDDVLGNQTDTGYCILDSGESTSPISVLRLVESASPLAAPSDSSLDKSRFSVAEPGDSSLEKSKSPLAEPGDSSLEESRSPLADPSDSSLEESRSPLAESVDSSLEESRSPLANPSACILAQSTISVTNISASVDTNKVMFEMGNNTMANKEEEGYSKSDFEERELTFHNQLPSSKNEQIKIPSPPYLNVPIICIPGSNPSETSPNISEQGSKSDSIKLTSTNECSDETGSHGDSGHISGNNSLENTPEHHASRQSHLSVPSLQLSTATDDKANEDDDDIDDLVASHRSTGSARSMGSKGPWSLFSGSRESMLSIYSDAGEVNYGKIPVSGEALLGVDYNYKTGSLEIYIKQCKDLAPVDMKRNKSDPYIKTYLLPDKTRSGKRKTKIKKHTLNPVFDEVLRYTISKSEIENRMLWITVWHNDRFGRNDFLGEVTLSLDTYKFGDSSPKWYPLQERLEEAQHSALMPYKGDLVVSLKYVTSEQLEKESSKKLKINKNKTSRKGALHIIVKEARNLTAIRSNGTSDPFCKGYLLPDKHKSGKQKTNIIKKNCCPVWNHLFVFDDISFEDLPERSLELTIWDHDTITSNDFLGGIRFNIGTGVHEGKPVDWMDGRGEEIAIWQCMIDRPNTWIDACVNLRASMGKSSSKK